MGEFDHLNDRARQLESERRDEQARNAERARQRDEERAHEERLRAADQELWKQLERSFVPLTTAVAQAAAAANVRSPLHVSHWRKTGWRRQELVVTRHVYEVELAVNTMNPYCVFSDQGHISWRGNVYETIQGTHYSTTGKDTKPLPSWQLLLTNARDPTGDNEGVGAQGPATEPARKVLLQRRLEDALAKFMAHHGIRL